MRLTFRVAIPILSVIVFALVFATFAFFIRSTAFELHCHDEEESIERFGHLIQGQVERLIRAGELDEISVLADSLLIDHEFESLVLLNAQGAVVEAINADGLHVTKVDEQLKEQLEAVQERPRAKIERLKNRFAFVALYPIRFPTVQLGRSVESVGLLRLVFDFSDDMEEITSLVLQNALVVFFPVLAIAVLALFLLKRLLTDRVEEIMASARRFLQGDRNVRANVSGHDEIGLIGSALNQFMAEIERSQTALTSSLKRVETLAETAADVFWETDAEGRFQYVAEGANAWRLGSFRFSVGNSIKELRGFGLDPADQETLLKQMELREPFLNFRMHVTLRNKESRYFEVFGHPAFDEQMRYQGYRGSLRDISTLVREQHRPELAEKKFGLAFKSVTVGMVMADERGIIETVNPVITTIFGYSEEELVGQNVAILTPEQDDRLHDKKIQTYLTGRAPTVMGDGREVEARRKDGSKFPIHLGLGVMEVDDGMSFVASISDLTDAKRLEAQLRKAQRLDAVSYLTGGVAHDFNNLLGVILGNLDLIRRKIEPDSKILRQIEKAINAAERGANLTGKMLDFSRQKPEQREVIDLNNALQDFEEFTLKSIFKAGGASVLLAEQPMLIEADKGDFFDALINLLVNARDAMPDGGSVEVSVTTATLSGRKMSSDIDLLAGDYVVLCIWDTGTGIPKNVLENIFEPYFTTKDRGKGTGLGLAMVYSFMRRSGGTVTVYSEEGVGTTFRLYFPLKSRADAAPERCTPSDPNTSPLKLRGEWELVLVVDDEQHLLEFAVDALKELGYRTLRASSGNEALAILKENAEIDLLFSDVIMPGGLNGVELAIAARELRPDLAIQLTSGYLGQLLNAPEARPFSKNLLAKPYSIDDLALAVAKALEPNPFTRGHN